MGRHSIRCEVCNKFITHYDEMDDGMCHDCAARLDQMAAQSRCKCYFVLFIVAVMLVVGTLVSLANAEELYQYKVSGHNDHTGLRVVGRMQETDKQGNLKARVYDEMEVKEQCFGAWVAYGVAQVGCENGHQYILEVVEE